MEPFVCTRPATNLSSLSAPPWAASGPLEPRPARKASRAGETKRHWGDVMQTFTVTTRERNEMVEITDEVRGAVRASGAREGICVVYCPHTTGAITVNENADPDVVHDLMLWYNRIVTK